MKACMSPNTLTYSLDYSPLRLDNTACLYPTNQNFNLKTFHECLEGMHINNATILQEKYAINFRKLKDDMWCPDPLVMLPLTKWEHMWWKKNRRMQMKRSESGMVCLKLVFPNPNLGACQYNLGILCISSHVSHKFGVLCPCLCLGTSQDSSTMLIMGTYHPPKSPIIILNNEDRAHLWIQVAWNGWWPI